MDTSKRSKDAPMTCNVVSCNGVSMPMVQEPGPSSFALYSGCPKFRPNVRSFHDESPTSSESSSSDWKQTERCNIFSPWQTAQIACNRWLTQETKTQVIIK